MRGNSTQSFKLGITMEGNAWVLLTIHKDGTRRILTCKGKEIGIESPTCSSCPQRANQSTALVGWLDVQIYLFLEKMSW
jgi:hypothetical protein